MAKICKQVKFSVELAKKIESGEIEGRIIDGDVNDKIRIICYDKSSTCKETQIVALINHYGTEYCGLFYLDGKCYDREVDCIGNLRIELIEEVPDVEPIKRTEFKPFDKVVVRGSTEDEWECDIFKSLLTGGGEDLYICIGDKYGFCVPYEGNENIIGTRNKPNKL
jgi:hypothetical protein